MLPDLTANIIAAIIYDAAKNIYRKFNDPFKKALDDTSLYFYKNQNIEFDTANLKKILEGDISFEQIEKFRSGEGFIDEVELAYQFAAYGDLYFEDQSQIFPIAKEILTHFIKRFEFYLLSDPKSGLLVISNYIKEHGKLNQIEHRQIIALLQNIAEELTKINYQNRSVRPTEQLWSNMPPPPSDFVGRSNEIEEISNKLKNGANIILWNTGGTGKTALAKKIAEVLKTEFSGGILWAYLGYDFGESILKQTFVEWVAAHPQGKSIQFEDVTPALIQNLLRMADGKILVIIDDVWNRQIFHELAQILPSHKVTMLITTRDKNVYDLSISNLGLFELHHLSPDDAYNLLTAQIDKFDKYVEELKQITLLLGRHALALKIASAWLVRNGVHDIPVLIASLEDKDLTNPFAELNLGDTRDNNLEKAFSLSYTSLDDDHKLYFRKLAAVPMGLRFTSEIAFAVWKIENRGDSLKAQKYLRTLVDAALVERNDEDGSYQLHFNLHAYAMALMIRQSSKEYDEYSQTLGKYFECVLGMAYIFGGLPPEEWAVKAYDIQHFHTLGAILVHQIQSWLEKHGLDVEMLSQPNLSFSPPSELNTNELSLFHIVSDLVFSLKEYIKSQHLDKEGKQWLSMGLLAARTLKQTDRELVFIHFLADWHRWEGQIQVAFEYTEKMSLIADNQKSEQYKPMIFGNIVQNYISKGEWDNALRYLEQILELSRNAKDSHLEAEALNGIGAYYSNNREWDKALSYLKQALAIIEELNDKEFESVILNQLGDLYVHLGKFDDAQSILAKTLLLRRAVFNLKGESITLSSLANLALHRGNFEEALRHLQKALDIQQQNNMHFNEGTTFHNIGFTYLYMSKEHWNKGKEYLELALQKRRFVGNLEGQARTLDSLADYYALMEQAEQAIEHRKQSAALWRDLKKFWEEAVAFQHIGVLYKALGKPEEARKYYEQALSVYRNLNEHAAVGAMLFEIGDIDNTLGHSLEALDCFEKALPLIREQGNQKRLKAILFAMGVLYFNESNFEQAIKIFEEVLPLFSESDEEELKALVLNSIGRTYEKLGNKQKAREYLEMALPIFRNLKNYIEETQILNTVGAFLRGDEQPELALTYYKKAEIALRKAFPQKTRPREREARELEATILSNMGLAYYYHESFQNSPQYRREAKRCHQNARIIYQELGDKEQEAQQLCNLSLLYDSQHSVELLEEALKILENDAPLSHLLPQIKSALMQRRKNFNIKVR